MKLFLPVFLLLFPFLAATQLRIDVMDDLIVNDVVYDPFSDRAYVSLPSENGANGNCIGVVNPYTFELEKAIFIGEEPTVLALSDDGQYIYVGFDGKPGAQRFDVATQTLGPWISVGIESGFGELRVKDLAVMPGHPKVIATTRKGNFFHRGTVIIDDGVIRPMAETTNSNVIAFRTSDTLIGYNNVSTGSGLRQFTIDENGLQLFYAYGGIPPGGYTGLDFVYYHGKVCFTNGQVADITGPAQISGSFTGGKGPVYFDTLHQQVCFVHEGNDGFIRFQRFDPDTYLPVLEILLPGVSGTVLRLAGWGPDRYVFCTDDQQLVFLDFGQVSTKESGSREAVVLFPNPASTVLRVGGQDPGMWTQYAIRSLDGVLLASGSFPAASEIPVAGLPNGVYLLTLWGESGMTFGKFAVLR